MGSLARIHSVHFYDTHNSMVERWCGVICSGLLIGNTVLIICTDEHRQQLMKALAKLEIDVRSYARRGRFSMFDATEMLGMFMVNDSPDPSLFVNSIGRVLAEAKKTTGSKDQGVTVFGEMVAVLWEQGNKAAALSLERLWNDAMQERAFHLHCAYPAGLFGKDEAELQEICAAHSHILRSAAA